jgi:hypothetical protein
MKHIAICISLLLVVAANGSVSGQCQNIAFNPTCSTVVGSCPTWAPQCGNGWFRSNGTPQFFTYTYLGKGNVTVTGYYLYMWSAGGSGEGAFTSFNFTPHQTMEFKVRVNTADGPGNLFFYAANGLSASTSSACGEAIPSVQKQLIGQVSGANGAWTDYTFEFTPNSNYTQLWIYPEATSEAQYNTNVMYGTACQSCVGTIVYNTGTMPVGQSISGIIQAGSSAGSGGSGVVLAQAASVTDLMASTEVDLLPEFQATVSGSGSFTAEVQACQGARSSQGIADYDAINPPVVATNENNRTTANILGAGENAGLQKILVYPTISTGAVTVSGSPQQLNNADLLLLDESGRQVFRRHNNGENTITLDLSGLRNGLYYLQVKNTAGVTIQKLIINK